MLFLLKNSKDHAQGFDRGAGGKRGVSIMLCAIAIIDSAARERLMKLEAISERFGFPPRDLHGHITLATYIGDDEEGFIASCKARLSGCGKFPVYYDKVEEWTSSPESSAFIVAVPRKEQAVVTIQKEVSKGWAADLNEWTQEDIWSPHTTLLCIPGTDLHAVAEAMRREFEPFIAQVERIEFSRVFESGGKSSFEIVGSVELR